MASVAVVQWLGVVEVSSVSVSVVLYINKTSSRNSLVVSHLVEKEEWGIRKRSRVKRFRNSGDGNAGVVCKPPGAVNLFGVSNKMAGVHFSSTVANNTNQVVRRRSCCRCQNSWIGDKLKGKSCNVSSGIHESAVVAHQMNDKTFGPGRNGGVFARVLGFAILTENWLWRRKRSK